VSPLRRNDPFLFSSSCLVSVFSPLPSLALALARPCPCPFPPSSLAPIFITRPRPQSLIITITFHHHRRLITSMRRRSTLTHRHLHFSQSSFVHSRIFGITASLPLPLSLSPGEDPRTWHAGTILHYKLEPTARVGCLVIRYPPQLDSDLFQACCLVYSSNLLVLFLVASGNLLYA